ncbi:MAG: hypothetical protein FD130_827, partial [Halothiobacillaceae bacterium]
MVVRGYSIYTLKIKVSVPAVIAGRLKVLQGLGSLLLGQIKKQKTNNEDANHGR